MVLWHLSHTDLDGYATQLIAAKFFQEAHFYNTSYGTEITTQLNLMQNNILETMNVQTPILFLITDINLNDNDCMLVNKIIARLKFLSYNVEIQLLDHHITGLSQSKDFDWYHLDTNNSATKICYEHFIKKYPKIQFTKQERQFITAVNEYDMWQEKGNYFEFGKVLNRIINESKEINKIMFRVKSVDYKHTLLTKALDYIEDNNFVKLDEDIFLNKKNYLNINKEYNTLDNILGEYLTSLLNARKKELLIEYEDYKGLLTFQIGNVSLMGNNILRDNNELDFFMDVNTNGNVSLRANGKLDVSEMAKRIFNGGGHVNASGGKIQANFRNMQSYELIKIKVQEYINGSLMYSK